MTASIHQLPASDGPSLERLRDAARTLSRMPKSMASAIEVIGLDLSAALMQAAASSAAAEFGLVAVVESDPTGRVRFERATG